MKLQWMIFLLPIASQRLKNVNKSKLEVPHSAMNLIMRHVHVSLLSLEAALITAVRVQSSTHSMRLSKMICASARLSMTQSLFIIRYVREKYQIL